MTTRTRLPSTARCRRRTPPARVKIKGIQGNVATFESPGPNHDLWRGQLKAFATGSEDRLSAIR